MGLGTAFLLSERGFQVTLLEKNPEVAQVASYINGSMICPSMCASWASLGLLAKVRNVIVVTLDIQYLWNFIQYMFSCIVEQGRVETNSIVLGGFERPQVLAVGHVVHLQLSLAWSSGT